MLPPFITFKPKAVRRMLKAARGPASASGRAAVGAARSVGVRGCRVSLKAARGLEPAKLAVLGRAREASPC